MSESIDFLRAESAELVGELRCWFERVFSNSLSAAVRRLSARVSMSRRVEQLVVESSCVGLSKLVVIVDFSDFRLGFPLSEI